MTPDWRAFPGPLPQRDGNQAQWRGGLVGCGALSAACLLRFHAERLGVPMPDRDALAEQLAAAQGAFRVPGPQGPRATWPWAWLTGLNAHLHAQHLPLRARGRWGPHLHVPMTAHLDRLFSAGLPVIGFEFSAQEQHYGLLSAYAPGPGLPARLHVDGSTLHLAPRLGLGGVFWIEPVNPP
ncbi:hypothetical protein [Deinococcus radiotolerans]|nr:hypothetical protein [Deinococcus radiotolerans]